MCGLDGILGLMCIIGEGQIFTSFVSSQLGSLHTLVCICKIASAVLCCVAHNGAAMRGGTIIPPC